MEIRNIRHKGLKNFVENDNPKGLPSAYVEKIRDIVGFLQDILDIDEVFDLKKYKPHILKGERRGVYSLSVSRNWRITFEYDAVEQQIFDLDYEDYH